MKVTRHSTPDDFLRVAGDTLEQQEVENNLILGLALRLQRSPETMKPEIYLGTVTDEKGLECAALMTPPRKLVFYGTKEVSPPAIDALIDNLVEEKHSVPGVLGHPPQVEQFASAWTNLTGMPHKNGMRERIYRLEKVISPGFVPGTSRYAKIDELDLMVKWYADFEQEALTGQPPSEMLEHVKAKISNGEILIWEDKGKPVSIAGKARPTTNAYCVGPVYTPPEFRGKGYASAATAVVSQHILDSGYKYSCLFTDLANPISNSIYQKIGYRPQCDFNEYLFG
jgi:predicted GNAT family acetyltransferase